MSDQVNSPKLAPCNKTSAALYQVIVTCLVPLLAALYCIMQLLYRGIMGIGNFIYDIGDFQRRGDYEHKNKLTRVFTTALFWFVVFGLLIPAFNMISNKFLGINILFNK